MQKTDFIKKKISIRIKLLVFLAYQGSNVAKKQNVILEKLSTKQQFPSKVSMDEIQRKVFRNIELEQSERCLIMALCIDLAGQKFDT